MLLCCYYEAITVRWESVYTTHANLPILLNPILPILPTDATKAYTNKAYTTHAIAH